MPDQGCPIESPNDDDLAPDYPPAKAAVGWQGESDSVTVRSTDYPAGGGLLLMVQVAVNKVDGRLGLSVVVFPYTDADDIPSCVRRGFGPGN